MKQVVVQLTAQSPIAVGEWMTSRSNVRESLAYIPGGVLRGALAQAVREHLGGHASSRRALGNSDPALADAFDACFGKDGARFGFLMPFETLEWIPAPATALFNKQRNEYLYDTLLALLRSEDYPMECPNTGDRLERGRGWLVCEDGKWRKANLPALRAFVRVGLNRKLEAAEEGVLYTLEAIDPTNSKSEPTGLCCEEGSRTLQGSRAGARTGSTHSAHEQGSEDRQASSQQHKPTVFQGVVSFPSDECAAAFDTILGALRWRDGRVQVRIGSARTRGFGAVVLETIDAPAPAPQVDLEAFAQRGGAPVFTLLARTPVLVHDASGMPALTLTPDLLREYLPDLPDSVQLIPKATRIERIPVSGWSGAWGMPKPVQQAFAPGSVFTYRYAESDRAALQSWLQQLALYGIGERIAEGYGQFAICSRYHLDTDITLFTQSNAGGAQ